MKGGEDFFFEKGKTALLLIHGFSSTPQEIHELGEYLAAHNITVHAPLLKGHGTVPEDLAGIDYTEWIDQMINEYKKLREKYPTVWVGGSSMGGNVALHIASRYPVAGVLALATPIILRFPRVTPFALWFMKTFRKTWRKRYPRRVKREIIDAKIHYWRYPTSSLWESYRCISSTKEILPKVTAPTLVMESTTDHIMDKRNAKYLYDHLGSADKQLVWVPNSYHVFTIDHWKEKAFAVIEPFISSRSK